MTEPAPFRCTHMWRTFNFIAYQPGGEVFMRYGYFEKETTDALVRRLEALGLTVVRFTRLVAVGLAPRVTARARGGLREAHNLP